MKKVIHGAAEMRRIDSCELVLREPPSLAHSLRPCFPLRALRALRVLCSLSLPRYSPLSHTFILPLSLLVHPSIHPSSHRHGSSHLITDDATTTLHSHPLPLAFLHTYRQTYTYT
ncbi:unnamed protein product [Periconia digitata]|uniref:Uncharacterized protein n=1 Tax=Periconia digitata TaxID=1303443 RepID=A0A9W4UNS9_9PLEO|nr:unnamed protein product [Periconia digitata]